MTTPHAVSDRAGGPSLTQSPEYFAVPDPDDPTRITYWRRAAAGKLTPWPSRARYGPQLYRSDVPADLAGMQRQEWIQAWARENQRPWYEKIHAALDADPQECAARFAAFATRCCQCGRMLHDPESKACGVGPDCRDGWPAAVIAAMVEAVGRAHALALAPQAKEN
ncbi:DUF6011 domain-containing protein [Micromonospora echinospora]